MPPSNPASDETIINGANDPVVQTCEQDVRQMWKITNVRPVKIVISASAQWGTIWRADGAFPVESETVRRIYCFSHSIDGYDPAQLIASGAVQYYAPPAQSLLQRWFETIARYPMAADDEALDHAYNFLADRTGLRAAWLPKEYCRYAWWIHIRPTIDHPDFPAPVTAKRDFQTIAGRARLNHESLRWPPPRSVFPRDCLIDVDRKSLFRLDGQGKPQAIGRFPAPLWIGGEEPR